MQKRKEKINFRISRSNSNLALVEQNGSKRFNFIQKSQSHVSMPNSPRTCVKSEVKLGKNHNFLVEPIKIDHDNDLFEEEDSLLRDLIGIMESPKLEYMEKKPIQKVKRIGKNDTKHNAKIIDIQPLFKIRTKLLSPRTATHSVRLKTEKYDL